MEPRSILATIVVYLLSKKKYKFQIDPFFNKDLLYFKSFFKPSTFFLTEIKKKISIKGYSLQTNKIKKENYQRKWLGFKIPLDFPE